ncbi:putative disease resistance protein RGA4 [Vitis vinifera]|uniref:Putative disease resistance protein RGA4 n=1 Tax=Vitis vinifera TaxID=29760 RepID=A0A438C059_VITVI|nr:putative disease resistance protein RGA4 [Vitis vinifera]
MLPPAFANLINYHRLPVAVSFAFDIANQVVGKLVSLALQEVALAWGVQADLEDLKNTISTIQAVISDAEEQQSNNRQLSDWLRKLNNALYEAEDVLDEFEYEALRRKVAKGGSIGKQENVSVIPSMGLAAWERQLLLNWCTMMKGYLLVLDDVWNNDREKWLELKELLMGGAGGSRIVVTTRKNSVASIMDGQGKHYPNLVKLGMRLVKRCGGFPRAPSSQNQDLEDIAHSRCYRKNHSNEVQHVLLSGDDPEEVLTLLQKITKLRTILFRNGGATSLSFVTTCASKFKYMRYLDLSDSSFEVLPSSIELEELPRDMGNLINLMFLVDNHKAKSFVGDREWGVQVWWSLPTSVKHLPALENLVFGDCERLNLIDGDGDSEDDIQGSSSRLCTFIIGALPQLEALPQWLIQGPTASNCTAWVSMDVTTSKDCQSHWRISHHSRNFVLVIALNFQLCQKGMHRLTTLKVLSIDDCPELINHTEDYSQRREGAKANFTTARSKTLKRHTKLERHSFADWKCCPSFEMMKKLLIWFSCTLIQLSQLVFDCGLVRLISSAAFLTAVEDVGKHQSLQTRINFCRCIAPLG